MIGKLRNILYYIAHRFGSFLFEVYDVLLF